MLHLIINTAAYEIYTLSLHDALPILSSMAPSLSPMRTRTPASSFRSTTRSLGESDVTRCKRPRVMSRMRATLSAGIVRRSEEHTSELQSPCNLVCSLLLEKKNKTKDK